MKEFRKKPGSVEAIQYTQENADDCIAWIRQERGTEAYREGKDTGYDGFSLLVIETIVCKLYVTPGDWIIKDKFGAFDIRTPYLFEETYETVNG